MATRRSYDTSGMLPDQDGEIWNSPVDSAPYQAPSAAPQHGGWTPSTPAPADYWIPPNANFDSNNRSGQINQQNPWADPDKPFVQAGTTGGYLDDVGITIGEGRSTTPGQAQSAWDQMVGLFGEGASADWIKRNPGDYTRGVEALYEDYYGGNEGGGGGAEGFGGGGGNGGGSGGSSQDSDLAAALKGLWGGGMNQDIINRRVSNASDTLNRFRKSQNATNQAALANRGLIGSGPEHTAMDSMEGDIADRFSNAVNGIWADEAENADDRMMQALGLSVGRESDQGMLDIQRSRLSLDEMLGMGGLALGNLNAVNDYNLGVGQLGLNRDLGMANLENMDLDRLIELIRDMQRGADGSADGMI
jgi:hypothetical protein